MIKNLFIIFIFTFLAVSCSTTKFVSNGKSRVAISAKQLDYKFKYEGQLDFFLLGAFPKEQVVDVDKIIIKQDHYYLANLKVSQYRTKLDVFLAIISFGIYAPQSFSVEVSGVRHE